jgi:hypothetical protein
MQRNHIVSYVFGTLSLVGALATASAPAVAANCVLVTDYSMLSPQQIDRIAQGIASLEDEAAFDRSMKCAQSVTTSKLSREALDDVAQGRSVQSNQVPTMQVDATDYEARSRQDIRETFGQY